jgi:holo-[acyl-carrier protein] synthase
MVINRMEIGVDCINISRLNKNNLLSENNLKRVFTEKEIQYCENKEKPSQHYAVRFAGKEAVIKAFFSYDIKINHKQIEILNKNNGIPFVKILDNRYDNFDIKISLSHSKETALAFVLINKIIIK